MQEHTSVTTMQASGLLLTGRIDVLEVNAFIKDLNLFCKKNGQKISIGRRLEVLIVNMMVRMIAGKRYVSRADGEANEEAQRVIKFIKEFASVLASSHCYCSFRVVPFLKWTDKWSSQVKSMKRISKEMESLIETWVDEHKLKKLKTGSNNNNQDFIDVMLSTIKDDHSMYGYTMEDCCVSGYHILKGTRLFVNAWKLHRDPQVWSNPEEFEPERRACPGMSWALQAICLTMARMLQGFDLTTPSNAPVDMNEDQGASATMLKATPLELILTPCLPRHLYQL
ncbi:hypothetical protein Gotur_000748 [Gossypium turneri]